MKKFKLLSIIFVILGVLLSDVMCAVVAYNWCDMIYSIQYRGYSAPASVSLILGIPYLVGIIICIILAYVFSKKQSKIDA